VARPLISTHWPDLTAVLQPLGGEYAARRTLLEELPFLCGYGVELGLLVDTLRLRGLEAIAQVDLGVRIHRNRPDCELTDIATAVMHAAASRMGVGEAAATVTRFRRGSTGFEPVVQHVQVAERPAYRSLQRPALPVAAVARAPWPTASR
jgi:glucosyl-3-phosphoglycerate synthase